MLQPRGGHLWVNTYAQQWKSLQTGPHLRTGLLQASVIGVYSAYRLFRQRSGKMSAHLYVTTCDKWWHTVRNIRGMDLSGFRAFLRNSTSSKSSPLIWMASYIRWTSIYPLVWIVLLHCNLELNAKVTTITDCCNHKRIPLRWQDARWSGGTRIIGLRQQDDSTENPAGERASSSASRVHPIFERKLPARPATQVFSGRPKVPCRILHREMLVSEPWYYSSGNQLSSTFVWTKSDR